MISISQYISSYNLRMFERKSQNCCTSLVLHFPSDSLNSKMYSLTCKPSSLRGTSINVLYEKWRIKFPKPTRGKMRIHCLENVDKALQFLKDQRVHLENMGSHDIVDGNPRLTLGLIWTIILRFQIQDITIEEVDNQETRSAKDALLLWCQMKTAGYNNVNIRNFTTSWRDGLAFNALIHKHRPDLLQYEKLSKSNASFNLNNAFNVAEQKLGLTSLLDAEDIFVDAPDEKSIITYVVTYYHYFSKMKAETVQGRRIGKVVGNAMENDRMVHEYETLTSDLLKWIEQTIEALSDRHFANSLIGVQQQLSAFNSYRTVEKPPKFVEKGNLEVLLFTLQSKMRANNQKPYFPKEGKMISDINRAWEKLEKSEHERELALREELISCCEKHEAIETDIFAYEERVLAVVAVAQELEAENYHDIDRINARHEELDLNCQCHYKHTFKEMLYILDSMEELKNRLLSDDYGKHLMGVQDLLQKHSLVEADINVLGYNLVTPEVVIERIQQLEAAYAELVQLALERRNRLEESRKLWQFYWDMAEDEAWIKEKEQIISQGEIGHDLTTVHLLIRKHKAMEDELLAHEQQINSVIVAGEDLINAQHFGSDKIQQRINEIAEAWKHLMDFSAYRRKRLLEAVDFHQFFADADDVDTWMLDTLRLVSSEDVGRDEANVQSLLKKHKDVTDELKNYATTIEALHQQPDNLGEEDREAPEVLERLSSIDRRYKELLEFSKLRKQRLLDALSLYKLYNGADGIEQWIEEKEKMLNSMDVTGRDIEDVEVMKHRFEGFEQEMNSNASRVEVVNQLAKQLQDVHPNSEEITARQNQLNDRWNELREKAEKKKQEIDAAHGIQTFHIECRETITWIEEKKKVLQSTQDLGNDLTGVMTLQRRLSGMERDLAAIQAKLDALEKDADDIEHEHPEEAAIIRERIEQITTVWEQLTNMLKDRDAKLEEAGDLHRFLRDLDHFQTWLTKTQKDIASEDIPSDLAESEKLLNQHKQIKEEIDNYTDDYVKMMEYGERITQDQDDPQYMFLRERLKALKDGWEELNQMWENRQQLLSQSLSLQMFMRDAKQCEVLLNQQEHILCKHETPTNLEQAENIIKRHEAFMTTMEANDEKINSAIQFAKRLCDENHFAADKIHKKAENINERRNANREKANQIMERLNELLQLHQFLQDCEELSEWIQEKSIVAQDETYRSAKTIHSKWTRHQAFEAEIASNKDRLYEVDQHAHYTACQRRHDNSDVDYEPMESDNETIDSYESDDVLSEHEDDSVMLSDSWKRIADIFSDCRPNSLPELVRNFSGINPALNCNANNSILEIFQNMMNMLFLQFYLLLWDLRKFCVDYWKIMPQKKRSLKGLSSVNKKATNLQSKSSPVESHCFVCYDDLVMCGTYASAKNVFSLPKGKPPSITIQLKKVLGKEFAEQVISDKICSRCERNLYRIYRNKLNRIPFLVKFKQTTLKYGYLKMSKKYSVLSADKTKVRMLDMVIQLINMCPKNSNCLRLTFLIKDLVTFASFNTESFVLFSVRDILIILLISHISVASKKYLGLTMQFILLLVAGRDLINEKPEYAETIEPKLQDLAQRFEDLENTTKTKGQKLFDANRQVIYEQTCDDIDGWITDLEGQMLAGETGQDLTSVNLTLKKHEMVETQMAIKAKQVEELESQAQHLQEMDPDKTDEIKAKKVTVEGRFQQLQAPLLSKKLMLEKKKEALQFRRDMEDERSWIREKMPLAESKDYGNSLFGVQMLLKKNQSLRTEIDNHEPRINYVCDNGRKLISEDHEDSEEFQNLIEELISMWKELIDAMDYRKSKLAESQRAQQYYFDVSEAEAWMSEQELYMMGEERGKDEISAQNLMKKHESLENAVEDYTETVRQLGETARQLINEGHPESDQIAVRQSQVDKLYAGLKDLASERRGKLDEALKLFMLNREVDDLVQWIAEREVVAGSHELGQDYDHVTMLRERFKQFAHDTETTGTERVAAVNYIADQLIASRHSDAATIAEWKDNLNEAWGDLLELIETRTQMLAASWSLHRFFHDCKDVYGRILEKQKSMSDELGRDAGSVSVLLRKHANFEHDLQTLASRVQEIQEDSDKLQASYAGDKAREITSREADVVNAWLNLQGMCEARKAKLSDTGDLFKFFNMVRTLMLWMDDLTRQMNSSEKPRDVSGVELLMNNHQSLKAEIDAREDKMSECISLGKELLERNHYASPEIKEKLVALTNQRTTMMTRWEERWEHLQLILEVYQFARDAAVAETWLISQDPYLLSQELGHTLDEVDLLIKRHEAFEKSAAAQEERFSALERLTTLELKDQEGRQNEDQAERRQAYKELDDHMRQSGIFEQFEVKEYHKKQQQEEERLRQEELAKASPKSASPDQHDDRPDGEGSPEHDHGFENGEREAIAETAAEVSTTPGVKSSRASRASSTTSSVSSAPISANERTPKVVEGTKQLPVNVTHPKSTPPPPPPAMSAEKDKKKRRSRSKSPFSSWRKKKSTPSVTDDELAHQQDADAARDEEEPCEGVLTRKHQWESTAKKASNRSWEKVYMVLKGNMLFAYKDQKHSKQEPETFFRNESPSNLSAAVADVASEYAKKKNVFKLNFNNGGEYLFQARDEDEMNTWVQRLRQATDGSAGPSRSQTLPASASREVEKKDEPKAKRGFFTLKRK
ncbi:Spectrin beta chain [Nymphon striatum]|nr:Spectrin beta chain [Nymphon striatum]